MSGKRLYLPRSEKNEYGQMCLDYKDVNLTVEKHCGVHKTLPSGPAIRRLLSLPYFCQISSDHPHTRTS